MHIVVALFLLVHGFAHLVGFVGSFALMPADKVPHITTILGGRVDLGETGIRVVGVLWLLAALAFGAAAVCVLLRAGAWPQLTLAVALASLALCVLGWPEARIGLVVNVAVIGLVAVALRTGWLVT